MRVPRNLLEYIHTCAMTFFLETPSIHAFAMAGVREASRFLFFDVFYDRSAVLIESFPSPS